MTSQICQEIKHDGKKCIHSVINYNNLWDWALWILAGKSCN